MRVDEKKVISKLSRRGALIHATSSSRCSPTPLKFKSVRTGGGWVPAEANVGYSGQGDFEGIRI